MRRVFADTLYWVAMTHRKDQWHQAAVTISRTLAGCHVVTTDEVLTEVLNAFPRPVRVLRQEAVHPCPLISMFDPERHSHPQSRQTFLAGMASLRLPSRQGL